MHNRSRIVRVTLGILVGCLMSHSPARAQNMLEQTGVKVSGLPGPLVLTGEATPLLVGDSGGSPAVVAARAKLGKGTLVAFGHGAFLNPKDDQPEARRFLAEIAATLPKDRPVAVDQKFEALAKLLGAEGFEVKRVEDARPIEGVSAAFVEESRVSAESVDGWRAYVEQGGVLVTGLPRWGWEQTREGKSFETEWAPFALFARAGIYWAGGMFDKGVAFNPPAPGAVLSVSQALKTFDADATADQKIAAGNQLQLAIGALPQNDALRKAITDRIGGVEIRWPTEKEPVGRDDALNRLAILAALQHERSLPAEQIKPNPAAADFPGAVPADAKPVSRQVEVDLSKPGWFVTGLYAAPGATITINVDGDESVKLSARIGSTTCNNTRHDKWTRVPRIDREWGLKPGTQTIASSFGGTIYIIVPKDLTGTRRIRIDGAVEQPVFTLGVDTDESWRQSRTHPAPWAELQSPLLSISVPSEYVRSLDNPTELMTWWNRVVELQDELSPRPGFPKRGERISLDRKTCAGYMHSGYPIMTHMDVAEQFMDLGRLKREGNWGIYHEIGHNHQWRDWTFDGTGEVTNNIFSLYSYAKLNPDARPFAGVTEDARKTKMAKFWNPDGPADQYKKDAIFALYMYMQVIEQFGFEPFQRFFARAAARPENERPKTDLQKRDRWLIDLSQETGRNLTPLFKAWGVVTSDEAQNAVKDLPAFEMRGLPKK